MNSLTNVREFLGYHDRFSRSVDRQDTEAADVTPGKLIAFASNLAFIFAVADTLLPAAAFADDLSDCTQTSDLPRVFVGCNNLISTPTALHDHTAIAYRNRSSAYAALGDFERAEQDHQHAIALNPR